MTNEQLAHELLLDPAFTLDEHGGARVEHSSPHAKIRSSFHLAFWNSLEDDLRLLPDPEYTRVARVLGEIRDGVADLASGGGAWAAAGTISSVLDLDLVNAQIKEGAFEWACCVRLVKGVMAVLLSFPGADAHPHRPAAVPASGAPAPASPEAQSPPPALATRTWPELQALLAGAADDATQRPHAFCSALRFMLDYVKAVRVAVANSRLRLLAPTMKTHGVEYERSCVDKRQREAEAAGNGRSWLDCTRAWVRACVRSSCASGSVSIADLTTLDHGKGRAFSTVLLEGFVSLVTAAGAFEPAKLAETLQLDKCRFAQLHAAFRDQVSVASVLVRVQQHLCQHKEPSPHAVLAAVQRGVDRALLACMPPDATLAAIVHATTAALEAHSTVADTQRNHFCAGLRAEMHPAGAVPRVVSARLRALLLRAVGGPTDIYRDTDTTRAVFAELNVPQVFALLVPKFRATGRLLRRVVAVHMRVYAPRYNAMIPAEAGAEAGAAAQRRRWTAVVEEALARGVRVRA